jgi:putative transposase
LRYTHRIAISNRRLVGWDDTGVTFKWKDYRLEGPDRYKTMTLAVGEFIRRFLMHVLPKRFPLRPVRQRCAGRQHCAGARAVEDGGRG